MQPVIELDLQGPWSTTSKLWPRTPDLRQAHHLLSRFAHGPTVADLVALQRDGCQAWWNSQVQLGLTLPGHAAAPAIAAAGPQLGLTPRQTRDWLKGLGREYGWDVMGQLTLVTLGLQVWSPAQLYEGVVDFFANHLNVPNFTDGQAWVRHRYDLDVIRKHAFGKFADMLVAAMRHPAMLVFLDQSSSTLTRINENLGRELLELHTVGLEAGYTESDVLNSARILTGLGQHDQTSEFHYRKEWHWTGQVRVLGFSHTNAVAAEGESVAVGYLNYLARHPSTAKRLARKLCVRYVSDLPPAGLVDRVAQVYLAQDTAILPMLETIVTSPEFWSSRRAKTRRPAENLAATLRILGARPAADLTKTLQTLHWMNGDTGHVPQTWAPPDGFPDVATSWRSTATLARTWSYHRGVAMNWWPDAMVVPPLTELYPTPAPTTSGAVIEALAHRLVGIPLPATHTAALQTFLGEPSATTLDRSTLRWQLGQLVSLILDSPQFAKR